MQSHIQLFKSNGQWIADHAGPIATQVIELFGTSQIPTAFTDKTPESVVVDVIKTGNPDCTVTVSKLR